MKRAKSLDCSYCRSGFVVIDKHIRKIASSVLLICHSGKTGPIEVIQHGAAETAGGAFFESYELRVVSGELSDQRVIERFGESCIGDSHADTLCLQQVGGFEGFA